MKTVYEKSGMDLNKRAKISAYFILTAYSFLLVVFNVSAPTQLSRLAGVLPLVIVLIFATYDNWLWRKKLLLSFAHRPDLSGTWMGSLVSYRRSENDVPIQTTHDVAIVIRQNFTSVSVTLMSAESKSLSGAAHIMEVQDDDFALLYQYRSEPKMAVRDHSPIHAGGSTMSIPGKRPKQITGEYWTARDSRGSYVIDFRSRNHAGTFDEAVTMKQGVR